MVIGDDNHRSVFMRFLWYILIHSEVALGSIPGSSRRANVVLTQTVLEAPPTLDGASGSFSKPMKAFVDACLQKDPSKRLVLKVYRGAQMLIRTDRLQSTLLGMNG